MLFNFIHRNKRMKKLVFALLIFLWGGYDVSLECLAEMSNEGGQELSNEIMTLAPETNDLQQETTELKQDTYAVQKHVPYAYGE